MGFQDGIIKKMETTISYSLYCLVGLEVSSLLIFTKRMVNMLARAIYSHPQEFEAVLVVHIKYFVSCLFYYLLQTILVSIKEVKVLAYCAGGHSSRHPLSQRLHALSPSTQQQTGT